MALELSTPVIVPERTYDRYGLLDFELHVRPDGAIDVAVIAQQANATHWSDDQATRIDLREPNLVAAIMRSADPTTAVATMQLVTDGLLYMLGMLMAEQKPGTVVFPPRGQ